MPVGFEDLDGNLVRKVPIWFLEGPICAYFPHDFVELCTSRVPADREEHEFLACLGVQLQETEQVVCVLEDLVVVRGILHDPPSSGHGVSEDLVHDPFVVMEISMMVPLEDSQRPQWHSFPIPCLRVECCCRSPIRWRSMRHLDM